MPAATAAGTPDAIDPRPVPWPAGFGRRAVSVSSAAARVQRRWRTSSRDAATATTWRFARAGAGTRA